MTHRLLLTLCLLAASGLAGAAPALAAPVPPERALYENGPDGRFLLSSGWSTRSDPRDEGLRAGWQRPSMRAGFRGVEVPHSFNARRLDPKGFASGVQWYRVRFRLPPGGSAAPWRLAFESVNRRAQVFLNGRRVGAHEGAHLPFELPATGVRPGDNELVVRVDGRLTKTDLPPTPRPQGWWNFGGILREVYLRRAGDLDLADLDLRPSNSGRVEMGAVVRNTTRRSLPLDYTVEVTGPDGATRSFPGQTEGPVAPGALARVRSTFQVDNPRLWSPDSPELYDVRVRLAGQTTRAHLGFREWTKTPDGRVLLNGRPLSLRGASFHEQAPGRGMALRGTDRDAIVRDLKSAGADFTRQHYAPHPALLEAFDREGIVFWEQIPLWRVRGSQIRGSLRREALQRLRETVIRDRGHASVMTWSLGNEVLRGGAREASYVRDAKALVRQLDPTRLVGIDKAISPASDINPAYRELDVLGVTEYLGWYGGSTAGLRPALDSLRARLPGVGLFVTEFGAEANRGGAATQKGTFAFQREYLDQQLGVMEGTPYLNGAMVWLLRDFVVRPGWSGGNPRPDPPFHRKGLFTERGAPKPALDVARERFGAMPFAGPAPSPAPTAP